MLNAATVNLFICPSDLDGFENLSTGKSVTGTDGSKLIDMNLETVASSANAPFEIDLGAKMGIFKIIIYAMDTSTNIGNWKVMPCWLHFRKAISKLLKQSKTYQSLLQRRLPISNHLLILQVTVVDDSSGNSGATYTDCADPNTSPADREDSYIFQCSPGELAATKVKIERAEGADVANLAEVVVVGTAWG